MDGQSCDKHPSARAAGRVLFANFHYLYMCNHCLNTRLRAYDGEYHVTYETVQVGA